MESIDFEEPNMPEEKVRVFMASDCYLEAKFAGIDPKIMAERLNKNEELRRVDRDSNLSINEAQNLVREAMDAGVDLSDPKKRAEYLQRLSEVPVYSEKTIHEKALEWRQKGLAEGKDYSIDVLENILRAEEKDEEIKKKRDSFLAQWEADIHNSGKIMTNEEYRGFINRRLKAAGYEILEEV